MKYLNCQSKMKYINIRQRRNRKRESCSRLVMVENDNMSHHRIIYSHWAHRTQNCILLMDTLSYFSSPVSHG